MAKLHTFVTSLTTPSGIWLDSGDTETGDTEVSVDGVVNANGGGANALTIAFPETGFQSLALLATVPCVVTLTGVTVIDAVSTSTITLAANTLRRVQAITGDCTAASVGANTDSAGLAGTIKISAIYNS